MKWANVGRNKHDLNQPDQNGYNPNRCPTHLSKSIHELVQCTYQ